MIVQRLKAAAEGWSEDEAGEMGASLAYYTLFSLAPLLLIAIAVLGTLYGAGEAKERLVAQVQALVDKSTAEAVRGMLESFAGAEKHTATSIVGIVSLLFGATGMFTSLRTSLHRIWRLKPASEGVVARLVRTYLLALGMVLLACVFLIVLLLVSTALPILTPRLEGWFPGLTWCAPVLDFLLSVLLLTLLFLFTFRILSEGHIAYSRLVGGACTSAVLFSAGKIAIGFYLSYVNLGSAYGAAGSLVVFLVWVYYSAQIVFFGAEVVRSGLPVRAA